VGWAVRSQVVRQLDDDDRKAKTGVFLGIILREQLAILLSVRLMTARARAPGHTQ
jgi:hypothetical protein